MTNCRLFSDFSRFPSQRRQVFRSLSSFLRPRPGRLFPAIIFSREIGPTKLKKLTLAGDPSPMAFRSIAEKQAR
jgi:hypothetical protein